MSLADDFKARFPEFPEATADKYLPILEGVWQCYFPKPYKTCNKEIILNLIAHLMVVEQSPGSSSIRSQTSRSVGSVSVSQGAVSKADSLTDMFSFTKYGQRFLFLTQSSGSRAYFV